MNKRLLVVLVFVVIGLAIFISGCTQQGQNTTQNNTIQNTAQNSTVQENKTNVNDSAKYNDISITQKGPTEPQKRGISVPIHYTVINNGKSNIYDVEVWSEDFGKYIGNLKPGQTKKYTYMLYIPTNKDLATWYDSSVKLNSPFEIGGIYLSFKDSKGIMHRIQSNSIEINLLK